MPLRTLLLSCVSADCDQHLWPAHKVTEHNSCIIKNHCTLIPDSERAVLCGGFGDGMGGWGDRSTCACSRLPCTLVTSLSAAVLLAAPPAELAIGKGLACFRDGAGTGLGGGTQVWCLFLEPTSTEHQCPAVFSASLYQLIESFQCPRRWQLPEEESSGLRSVCLPGG